MKKFDITRVGWPDNYKKANRRKPVVCVLCEKEEAETKNDSGVCSACLRSYMVGKAYERYHENLKSSEEEIVARIPNYPSFSRGYALERSEVEKLYGGDGYLHEDSELGKAVLALADITPTRKNDPDVTVMFGPGRENSHDYREDAYAVGSRLTFATLQKVFVLLNRVLHNQYREGYRDGQSVITSLASGAMTVDQLNEYETKRKVK